MVTLCGSACVSGGSVVEEGSEGPESSDRRADQACGRAGEQALNQRGSTSKNKTNLGSEIRTDGDNGERDTQREGNGQQVSVQRGWGLKA